MAIGNGIEGAGINNSSHGNAREIFEDKIIQQNCLPGWRVCVPGARPRQVICYCWPLFPDTLSWQIKTKKGHS